MENNLYNLTLGNDSTSNPLVNNYGSGMPNNYGSGMVANNYTNRIELNLGEIIVKNMKVKQVNVVIFKVSRNEKNEVISSEVIQDLWVELKPGADLMLTVAKTLDPKYNPEEIIVKEIRSFEF